MATFEDVRRYQLHLTASGIGVATLNQTVPTLRFFFRVTLKRHNIVEHTHFNREPRKLPVVLSPEEVARILDAAPGPKYKAALSVAYGAGLRASEVISLKVCDIDSKRMLIRVEQGKFREHLGVVVAYMSVSKTYLDFIGKLDHFRPRFDNQYDLPFEYVPENDDGRGL